MINKTEIIKELTRLNQYTRIKVQGTDKERLVFVNSDDVFKIWGSEAKGVLVPFNDYTYEWLNSFLYAVCDLLERNEYGDLEEFKEDIQEQMPEWVDSEVDIYYSAQNEWFSCQTSNNYYLEKAVEEGHTDNLIAIAQYHAIDELFNNALNELMSYLEDVEIEVKQ